MKVTSAIDKGDWSDFSGRFLAAALDVLIPNSESLLDRSGVDVTEGIGTPRREGNLRVARSAHPWRRAARGGLDRHPGVQRGEPDRRSARSPDAALAQHRCRR